ncbi:hypothetical protein EV102420_15_00940 [Pseudescherichia vulneris NBRC 102420]|uniref:Uncharacterized protein n=1 Tax=Pseudescherichia vulneris NBRC 102420 TaxID=1115515 RepID=A0A090VVI3_PSEVU|nr:hypothetical protein EV102420_15_00940 [Pseudescherichia vulneris NBRC 102420]STQ59394.1 Uncharacterised protein [Pseudescherichia vulneris]
MLSEGGGLNLIHVKGPDSNSFTNCRLPKYESLSILIAHEPPDVSDSTKKQATKSRSAFGGCLLCHVDLSGAAGQRIASHAD